MHEMSDSQIGLLITYKEEEEEIMIIMYEVIIM